MKQRSFRQPGRLLASMLVATVMAIGLNTAFADVENALGIDFLSTNGTYSAIEGAAPAIRDGGWSYMRTGGQRFIGPDVYYIEIGWLWTADDPNLRAYWTYRATNGFIDQGLAGTQGCCVGYNYRVLNVGAGNWNLYFNSLSTPVATVWTGFDFTDDYFSGGEVSSAANAMGIAGNINVAYLQGGNWFCACGWQPWVTNPIYNVTPVINPTSWQVWGNN